MPLMITEPDQSILTSNIELVQRRISELRNLAKKLREDSDEKMSKVAEEYLIGAQILEAQAWGHENALFILKLKLK